jgi:hypothetical protein
MLQPRPGVPAWRDAAVVVAIDKHGRGRGDREGRPDKRHAYRWDVSLRQDTHTPAEVAQRG